jgi:hypothetical protein
MTVSHKPVSVTRGPDPGAAAYLAPPPDAAPGMSFSAEGLGMTEGGRAGNSEQTRTTPRAAVGPSWISMSAEICPGCRVRYLPLDGRCACHRAFP